MEITSQIAANGRAPRDSREELRPGQVVSVNIKERISDREAIISIRGQEVRASFEGKVPQGERALVEVRSNDAQTITVRAMDDASVRVTGKGSVDSDIQQIAKQFGEKLTPDLRQALRIVVDSGTPLSKELVQQVRAFLDTRFDSGISGNPKQTEAMNRIDNKLDTLQAAVTKNINISQVHLQAIHEALHGSSLTEAIKGLKNELGNLPRENYLTNETLQSLTTLNTKDFLISVVTKKMAEVGNDFRDLRRDITKNMGNMVRVLETGVRGTEQVAQRMIEPTIQMLDKAILKSDMFLFTDMKTEKTLMKASGDLETAREMLAKGDRKAALKIVQQVQDTISNLKWKPSADRVQRFVMEGQQQLEQLKQIGNRQPNSNQPSNPFVMNVDKETMSGRQVFDFMRSLGLNHESEAAQRLIGEIASKEGAKGNLNNAMPTNREIQATQNTTMQLTKEAQELLQRPAIRDAFIQAVSQAVRQETSSQQAAPAQPTQQAPTQATPATNTNLTQILTQALQNVRQGGELYSSVQELQRSITSVDRQGIPQEVLQRVAQLEQSVRSLDQTRQPARDANVNANVDPRIVAERNVAQTTITRQMNELLELVQRQPTAQQSTGQQPTQINVSSSQSVTAQAQPAQVQQILSQINTAIRQGGDTQPLLQDLQRVVSTLDRQEPSQTQNITTQNSSREAQELLQRPAIREAIMQIANQVQRQENQNTNQAQRQEVSNQQPRTAQQVANLTQVLTEALQSIRTNAGTQALAQNIQRSPEATDRQVANQAPIQDIQKTIVAAERQGVAQEALTRVAQLEQSVRTLEQFRQPSVISNTESRIPTERHVVPTAIAKQMTDLLALVQRQVTNQQPSQQQQTQPVPNQASQQQAVESQKVASDVQQVLSQISTAIRQGSETQPLMQKLQKIVATAERQGIPQATQATQTAQLTQATQTVSEQQTRETQELMQRPAIREALTQIANQIQVQRPETQQTVPTQTQATMQPLNQSQQAAVITQALAQALQNTRASGDAQAPIQDMQKTIVAAERQGVAQEALTRVAQLEQSVRQLEQFRQPSENTNTESRIPTERHVVPTAIAKQMTDLLALVQRQVTSQQPSQVQQPVSNQAVQQQATESQKVASDVQQVLSQISTAIRQGSETQPLMQELQRMVATAERQGIPLATQATQTAQLIQATQTVNEQQTREAQELMQRPAIREALTQIANQVQRFETPTPSQQTANLTQVLTQTLQSIQEQQRQDAPQLVQNQTGQLTKEVQELLQRPAIREALMQIASSQNQATTSNQQTSATQQQANQNQTVLPQNQQATNVTQALTQAIQNVRQGNEMQLPANDQQRTIASAERQGITQEALQRVSQLEQSVKQLQQFRPSTNNTTMNMDSRMIAERNIIQSTVTRQMNELLALVQRQATTTQLSQQASQQANQSQQVQQLQQGQQAQTANQNQAVQQSATQQTQTSQTAQQQQPTPDPQRVLNDIQQLVSKINTATRQGGETQSMIQELNRAISNAERQGMPQPVVQKLEQLERSMQQADQHQKSERILQHLDPRHRNPQQIQQLLNQLQGQDAQNKNLKSTLMEIIKQTMAQRGAAQQTAEQTLNQLTGQQLLSKGDSHSNNQTMFFQLPVAFQEQINNLKVFVNGKNKGEKMDWENCSLYFLLETKKLGEIGIQVSAANRNLSVMVKNDTPGIQRFFDPLIERFTNQLNDVGYQVKGINFTRLTELEIDTTKPKIDGQQEGNGGFKRQRGFDLKI